MQNSTPPRLTTPIRNRRIVATARGGPDVLRLLEEAVPAPQADEVRVRVLVAGVLLGDVFWQQGLIPGSPNPPFTPGYDVIGVVDGVGAGVRQRSRLVTGWLRSPSLVATAPMSLCQQRNLRWFRRILILSTYLR